MRWLLIALLVSLAALLNRLHREKSNADSDEGNHAEPDQSRKQRLPGSEV